MKTRLNFRIVSLLFLFLSLAISAFAQQRTSDQELKDKYHLFDFWIGEWDVYKNGTDTIVGKSHIMSINDGMGLLENYETPNGKYKGKSLNTYNRSSGKWEQYWIDNSGLVLKLEGDFMEGSMILEGMGGSSGNRISWQLLDNGNVRQLWEIEDKNQQWKVAFDGIYKKR